MKNLLIIAFIILFSVWNKSYASSNFMKALNTSLASNPEYQTKAQQAELQNTLSLGAKTKLFIPTLSLSHSNNSDQSTGSDSITDYRLTRVNLSYSLFNFGSDYQSYKAAQFGHESFKNELSQTYLNQEESMAKLILDSISKYQSMLILEEIVSLKKSLYQLSRKRFNKGLLSSDDLLKVEIDLSNANSSAISAKQSYLITSSSLEAYKITKNIRPKDFPFTTYFKNKGMTKVKNLHKDKGIISPELEKLRLLEQSKVAQLTSKKRDHLGSFSINYSRNLYQEDRGDDQYGYSTSLTYTLPLFDNFSTKIQTEKLKAESRSAKLNYNYKKRLITIKKVTLRENLELSFKNFKNRLTTLAVSKKIFSSSTKQFKRGKLSVNDLFIEQNRLLTTKLLTNDAIYDLHLKYIQYLHLYGFAITQNQNYIQ